MAKVAINGIGRIGLVALKIILDTPELELVVLNELMAQDNLVYLLKYDTVYSRYEKRVETADGDLVVAGKRYRFLSEKDPARLPWRELGVDIVFECTEVFTRKADLEKHLRARAKRVILSAPVKGEGDIPMVVCCVNVPGASCELVSCASCTTNCIAPVMEVMGRRIGVIKAIMTTIHACTSSQAIVDGPAQKWRRGRAGAANLVPTSTGAAIAATETLPEFKGKFDGVAVRAPVPAGSLADIVFLTARPTTAEEVNTIFREEAVGPRYRNVLGVAEDPIVSSDVIMDPRASIVDLSMTKVVDGNLVKVMSWYDNEWGYTNQMVREAVRIARECLT
jgi:glyceraldehyde 3-phosphate dehydrogenase